MKNLILFLLIVLNSFGASLLSTSVNENDASVEINLTFDAPFDGSIEQNSTESSTILKISGIAIDSKKEIPLNQNSLMSMILMSKDGPLGTKLEFITKKEVVFEALKNNDGYKLQLKAAPAQPTPVLAPSQTPKIETAAATPAPKQDDDGLGWRYIVVISFLTLLVAIAFYIKKRVIVKNGQQSGWLLPKSHKPEDVSDDVKVITQSFLDPSNKLMLVEYSGIKYLLLVGNTNVVVDRYYADDADTQGDDFKRIMAENERKLAEFLKPQQQLSNFDEYRMKAEGNY